MRALIAAFCLGIIAFICGCASVNESEENFSGPWTGPGVRSREIVREVLPSYSPTGVKTTYWTDANGRRVPAVDFTDQLTRYWASLGLSQNWPRESDAGDYGRADSGIRPQRVIVSIKPIVVILTAGRSETSLPSVRERTRRCGNNMVFSRGLVFEYGTNFYDREEIFWVSPDLGIKPTAVKVDRSSGVFNIDLPQVSIHARLKDNIWYTERLR